MKPVTRPNLLAAILDALGEGRPRQASPERAPVAAAGRPLHILLAEDNVVNQKVAARLLEKQGHFVEVASNGVEALAALESKIFDLILMDAQMPVMNGYNATEVIRERERGTGQHIPIVALTAHAMKGDRETCLNSGMDDYLGKPIHPMELVAMMERWGRPRTGSAESIPLETPLAK